MKAVQVPDELHEKWKEDAKENGLTLVAYVTRAVEALRTGQAVYFKPSGSQIGRPLVSATVNPRDCLNRLPVGAWCSRCSSIHGSKKNP